MYQYHFTHQSEAFVRKNRVLLRACVFVCVWQSTCYIINWEICVHVMCNAYSYRVIPFVYSIRHLIDFNFRLFWRTFQHICARVSNWQNYIGGSQSSHHVCTLHTYARCYCEAAQLALYKTKIFKISSEQHTLAHTPTNTHTYSNGMSTTERVVIICQSWNWNRWLVLFLDVETL